jgi:MFS family permease
MSAVEVLSAPGFFSKERITAGPGFNRWIVPPAALAIHLCIGMAYGFSVFWIPLSKALGVTSSIACRKDLSFLGDLFDQAFTMSCDWKISTLAYSYILFFVFLGLAAALWGGWVERVGPRKAGMVATLCWCGGLVMAAGGVIIHQLWLMWLGSGVIGGIGLGLGYISPVSTLVKWFPDRRGMSTGLAIMGFGGGAMIGAPLADKLMKLFATPTQVGVWQTFVTIAAIYFVFMICGALGYRIPAPNWKPEGWKPPGRKSLVTDGQVHADVAWRTPQFWLLWSVLTLNVTAGIGVLGMASPLLQEVFGGRLIGVKASFDELTPAQLSVIAATAAGFTGLLSLFNILGRIFWASLSDQIGRQATYMVFFLFGAALYAAIPWTADDGSLGLFVAFFCIILSMYGGGFAAVPAYLADLFGSRMVSAIHGRLLTAWSTAGVLGPVLVNYIREYQISHGVPKAEAYSITMYILAGLLAIGFVCNLMIQPVAKKYYMTRAQIAELDATNNANAARVELGGTASTAVTPMGLVVGAWAAVSLPLAWGVYVTSLKAIALFSQ